MAPPRISAISPVSRASPAWSVGHGPHPPAVAPLQAAVAPIAAPAATESTAGLLASMQPVLPPGWEALANGQKHPSRGGQQLPSGAPADTSPAPLASTLVPPEARLARPSGAPAAPLAAAWRAQVLTGHHAAADAAVPRAELPSGTWAAAEFPSLASVPAGSALLAAGTVPSLPAAPPPDRMGYLLHAWNGQPVALRLMEPEPEDPPATAPRGLPALRLALDLPLLGRMVLQLQLAQGGIWLAIAVEEPSALAVVQAALPAFTQALGQAGLRLLRWRLERGSGHGSAFANLPLHLPPSATQLAPALFRAAAEVVLVLQQADELAALAAANGMHRT
ncbi:flagellar hook-length control protein FliK [Aquincola sp. MAHUQ-54]|uniref:Flagellar hook-length control protein FliK n=1 Tax=Aquincola agrisoli TaxID=3119538 RepID=A0AAW9QKP5_9BURK